MPNATCIKVPFHRAVAFEIINLLYAIGTSYFDRKVFGIIKFLCTTPLYLIFSSCLVSPAHLHALSSCLGSGVVRVPQKSSPRHVSTEITMVLTNESTIQLNPFYCHFSIA